MEIIVNFFFLKFLFFSILQNNYNYTSDPIDDWHEFVNEYDDDDIQTEVGNIPPFQLPIDPLPCRDEVPLEELDCFVRDSGCDECQCNDGLDQFAAEESDGNKKFRVPYCYKVHKNAVDQLTAMSECMRDGMQLASIQDPNENSFTIGQLKMHGNGAGVYWIGQRLFRDHRNGTILSIVNTDGTVGTFGLDEIPRRPWLDLTTLDGEDCVAISIGLAASNETDGTEASHLHDLLQLFKGWTDLSCEEAANVNGFICKERLPKNLGRKAFNGEKSLSRIKNLKGNEFECTLGWNKFEKYCLLAFHGNVNLTNFPGAMSKCADHGATLLTMPEADIFYEISASNYLNNMADENPKIFWIGLYLFRTRERIISMAWTGGKTPLRWKSQLLVHNARLLLGQLPWAIGEPQMGMDGEENKKCVAIVIQKGRPNLFVALDCQNSAGSICMKSL